MKTFITVALAWLLSASVVFAQLAPPSGGGGGGGGSGTPGGSSGQIQYNNAGAFGGFNLGGDCSFSQPTITCLKTNGVNLGVFATGTDAANLTGTVSVNRFNNGTGASSSTFLRGDGTWAAAGAGTVTSITPGLGLGSAAGTCSGSAITASGTLSACNPISVKTANYTLANADGGSLIVFNSASALTATIPQATASGNFANGWSVCVASQQGQVTLAPQTSTIYVLGSLILQNGQTACFQSDGTNYAGTGGALTGPITASGILTLQSGAVETLRVITAAGVVTAATTDVHICITKASGAATTVNLFASPTTGTILKIEDCKGDAATNNITIVPAAGNIDGASTFVLNNNWAAAVIVYNGTLWKVVSSR